MSDKRETNKAAKPVQLSCVPPEALESVARHMGNNRDKYGRDDYRNGGPWSLFYDAAFRHMNAWWMGENTDAENGSHHLDAAIANLMMLKTLVEHGAGEDDRPNSLELHDDKEETPCFHCGYPTRAAGGHCVDCRILYDIDPAKWNAREGLYAALNPTDEEFQALVDDLDRKLKRDFGIDITVPDPERGRVSASQGDGDHDNLVDGRTVGMVEGERTVDGASEAHYKAVYDSHPEGCICVPCRIYTYGKTHV